MGDAPYRRRHENRAGGGVEPNNPPWLLVRKNIVILGAASHGLHCRLWSVRGRSARWSALTGPWATPPIAGAMKIERGWMYYPTIHYGDYLGKKSHPGLTGGHERRPLPPVPCKSIGGLWSILFILINILFILINPSCPCVLVSQPKHQSTIIGLDITWLDFARLCGEVLF